MTNPGCGSILGNYNQQRCGQDIDYGEDPDGFVAPATGSEGSSDVLPVIQNRNENRSGRNQSNEQANNCIGYECDQDGSSADEMESPSANSSPPAAPVTGYFSDEFLKTGKGPVTADEAAEAAAVGQAAGGEGGGGGPGGTTGYFNSDFTGRADQPPKTHGDSDGDIPVNVTLVPVSIDGGNPSEPPPANPACSQSSGPVLSPQSNSCVNTPLVGDPGAEPPETGNLE